MKCVPGDMAFIIDIDAKASLPKLAENIGAVVDVLSLELAESARLEEPIWTVRARGPLVAYSPLHMALFNQVVYYTTPPGTTGCLPDRLLQPIRGQKTPEKIETPEDLGCFTV